MPNPKDKVLGDVPVPTNELETPKAHDLSHQRDERCVPIAHELVRMLAVMDYMPVGGHINEKETPARSAYIPVIKDFLKLLIDKDVKLTEITYIFSLVRQALEFVSDAVDETCNQNMNRVTELVYGLELNKSDDITLKQLNETVMHKDKLKEVWDPILAEKIEMKDN